MKADQYRQYAVECWLLACQEAKNRDYWMASAARWMVLAAFAAKAEGRQGTFEKRTTARRERPRQFIS